MLALVSRSTGHDVFRAQSTPIIDSERERSAELPLFTGLSADMALPAADEPLEYWASLDAHLIRDQEMTFLVRVRGDDFADAGLKDGDLLIMDRSIPPLAGSVVVVTQGERAALRRLGRNTAGELVLEPSGDGRPGITDDPLALADCEIWGVARWVIQRLWPRRDQCSVDQQTVPAGLP